MSEFDFRRYYWQGCRVRLRPHQPTDWAAKYAEFIDSDNRRILEAGVDLPRTAEEYRQLFADDRGVKDSRGNLTFAVESLEGEFVGWANIHGRSEKNGTFSCAVGIFTPYRRLGYAADALQIVLRYGFHELRYQKCNLQCLAENTASIRLQQSLGFVQEGLRRRTVYTGGQFHDEYLSGLTREEFDARWQRGGEAN